MNFNKKNNNNLLRKKKNINLLSVSCGLIAFSFSLMSYGKLITSVNNHEYLIQESIIQQNQEVVAFQSQKPQIGTTDQKVIRRLGRFFNIDYKKIPLQVSYIMRGRFFTDYSVYDRIKKLENKIDIKIKPTFNAQTIDDQSPNTVKLDSLNIQRGVLSSASTHIPANNTDKDNVKLYSGQLNKVLPENSVGRNIDVTPITLDLNLKAEEMNNDPLMSYETQNIDIEESPILRTPTKTYIEN